MKTVSTVQNTDEWYKMRNNYIGASEANIIMKKSKFKTPLQLWEQKVKPPEEGNKPSNFIQAKGHRLEEKMRPIMEMLYDTDLEPLVVLSEEYDFLMASLDGYSKDKKFNWENKFVGEDDYQKVANKEMLEHYIPQVQHQLMLTGAPFCVFTVVADNKESTNPDFPFKYAYIEVKPDIEYMKNELLPNLIEFWDLVKTKTKPGIEDKDSIDLSSNEELADLLNEYKTRKEALDILTKQKKDVEAKIYKSLGKYKKASCNGVKISISRSKDKEAPDLDRYLAEKNIDEKLLIDNGYVKTVKGRLTKRITFPKSTTTA